MNWITWVVIGVIVLGLFLLKRSSFVSHAEAKSLLARGARIIDVRTEAEYKSGHLAGAVNIPLDDIRESIARAVPDTQTPLLLHCAGGVRSGMAKRILKQMGYANAHNLGSYSRAAAIADAR